MRVCKIVCKMMTLLLAGVALLWPQADRLQTADAVLERYKHVLGGADVIKRVQSETVRGEIEATDMQGRATFVYYAKPCKSLIKIKRPDGGEVTSGFDGSISWSINPKGATIDRDTAVEAMRRDTDFQYPLHQPDYFQKLEFAGVTQFDGRSCYWLHGT